jgi:hypothetical protein
MRGEAVALQGERHRRNKPLADDDDHRNVVATGSQDAPGGDGGVRACRRRLSTFGLIPHAAIIATKLPMADWMKMVATYCNTPTLAHARAA